MSDNKWIIRPKANANAKIQLFCFPFAGGGANVFRPWTKSLPQDIELCMVQYPGREGRIAEPAINNIDQMLQALLPAISPYTKKPYAFFGHSMGAIIAFELTRKLRQNNQPLPVHFFASGRRAPHFPGDEDIAHLPEPQFIEKLREFEGTPEAVLNDKELMELFLPMLRADFALIENYRYTKAPPLECPVTAWGGETDHKVSKEQLAGWQDHAAGPFKMHIWPGGHFFINSIRDSIVQAIAENLYKTESFL